MVDARELLIADRRPEGVVSPAATARRPGIENWMNWMFLARDGATRRSVLDVQRRKEREGWVMSGDFGEHVLGVLASPNRPCSPDSGPLLLFATARSIACA